MKKVILLIGSLMCVTEAIATPNTPLKPGDTPLEHLTWAYESSKILLSRDSSGLPTHVTFYKCEPCKQESFRLAPNASFRFIQQRLNVTDTEQFQGFPGVVELNQDNQAISITFDEKEK